MTLSVFAISNRPEVLSDYMPKVLPYEVLKFNRDAKSALKNTSSLMLFIDLLDGLEARDAQKILKSIAMNANFYLVLLTEGGQLTIGHNNVDEIITSYEELSQQHYRLVNLYNLLDKKEEQASQLQSQTDLLLSINHFAQFKIPWKTLLNDFALSLSGFCSAASVFLYDNKHQVLSQVLSANNDLPTDFLVSESMLQELSLSVRPLTQLAQPNVHLMIEATVEQRLSEEIGINIEAILSFPLVVYDQNYQTIICLIDEKQMPKVSVQQIDIMKEAAIQLRILIERRVAESKLKSQFQRLKNTLQELQTTKEQLAHSDKMAAVGKLAAGIAHEINNPLSYVLGNLEPLDDYIKTISKLLNMHEELLGQIGESISESSSNLKQQIVQEQEQEDLDFVLEDIKSIVDNSKDGLLRVKDIINDLSSFSRQQPLELQTFSLADLLEETVRLMKFEASGDVEIQIVTKEFIEIEAQRGFTQQILTNLVKNAIHALQDAAVDGGLIKLSFTMSGSAVSIAVEDNGPGVPDEMKQSIFTPFFTTKGIGKGTGLGLSVSYNLAKKMNGSLALESKVGRTVFTLLLPKKGSSE